MPKNHELVYNATVEKFKENLKFVIYDGASLLDMDELRKAVSSVCEEVLSFLESEAKGKE